MIEVKNEIKLEKTINRSTMRHYINGANTVFHCHHYTSLYLQLALDAGETALMARCAEDTFFDLLTSYFKQHAITDIGPRIAIAEQYFKELGLGTITVEYLGSDSGKAVLPVSHVDAGWIKKWGTYDKPVNYIAAGYLAALAAAVFSLPAGSFTATETQSMVTGADCSIFNIVRK